MMNVSWYSVNSVSIGDYALVMAAAILVSDILTTFPWASLLRGGAGWRRNAFQHFYNLALHLWTLH